MTTPHLSLLQAQGWCFSWTAGAWGWTLLWGVKLWHEGLWGSFVAGVGLELEREIGLLWSPGFFSGTARGSDKESGE